MEKYKFIEICPKITRMYLNDNRVRASFIKNKVGIYLNISIGKNIAEKVGFFAKDRVSFNYDSDNHKIWLLKRNKKGYSLLRRGSSLCLKFLWNKSIFDINHNDMQTREIKSSLFDDGILLKYKNKGG